MSNYFTDNPTLERVLRHPAFKEIVRLREGDFAEAARYDFAPRNIEVVVSFYSLLEGKKYF